MREKRCTVLYRRDAGVVTLPDRHDVGPVTISGRHDSGRHDAGRVAPPGRPLPATELVDILRSKLLTSIKIGSFFARCVRGRGGFAGARSQ
jgi:hypothetical protein